MKTLVLGLSFLFSFGAVAVPLQPVSSRLTSYSFRLKPGQDFMQELREWAKQKKIKAGVIISVVGSFKKISLRYANQPASTTKEGYFEIVSLVGTFNDQNAHLHASVADEKGATLGGHLMPGNIVYTTAEVVVADLEEATFHREHDEASGWDELVIRAKK